MNVLAPTLVGMILFVNHILSDILCCSILIFRQWKVCGPVQSTWGTSLGEDKLGARARILNTKVVHWARPRQLFPLWRGGNSRLGPLIRSIWGGTPPKTAASAPPPRDAASLGVQNCPAYPPPLGGGLLSGASQRGAGGRALASGASVPAPAFLTHALTAPGSPCGSTAGSCTRHSSRSCSGSIQ